MSKTANPTKPDQVTPAEVANLKQQVEDLKQQLTDARAQTCRILTEHAHAKIMESLGDLPREFRDVAEMASLQALDTETDRHGDMSVVVVDPKTGQRRYAADGPMSVAQLGATLKAKFASVQREVDAKDQRAHGDDWRPGRKKPVTISESDAEDFTKYQEARRRADEQGVELVITRDDK